MLEMHWFNDPHSTDITLLGLVSLLTNPEEYQLRCLSLTGKKSLMEVQSPEEYDLNTFVHPQKQNGISKIFTHSGTIITHN